MLKTIDHLGIAVKDLSESMKLYRDVMGLELLGEEVVAGQSVKVAIFKIGEVKIELLEATSEDSPIAKFLAAGGRGIHHVAYRVDDVEKAIAYCQANGLELIDKSARSGAHGAKIAFLHPRSTGGVLTELVSTNRQVV
jgi:methylmalonyl-CoA/ethylmalonyl-CoA epimerase